MKNNVAKWLQKIKLLLVSIIILSLFVILCFVIYWYTYLPYKADLLYKDGITNVEKANNNAVILLNESYCHRFDDKAIALLRVSASKEEASSFVLLGNYYKKCTGIKYGKEPEYRSKSSYYFLQAAKKGNAEAQKEIGLNYKYGIGVKRNIPKALYWLKLSAFKKYPYALYELGNIYLNGLALYDINYSYLRGPYGSDFDYNDLLYNGENIFITKNNVRYKAKNKYLDIILENPQVIYLKPNITKAKYYWNIAAKCGLKEAVDALEKIYN